MHEYTFLIAIAGVLLVGAMSPGPSFMMVARNSLSRSRSHGFATAIGTGLGVCLFAILASFGVTTLLQKAPFVFFVFKIAGAVYLLYLAWRIWVAAPQPLQTSDAQLDQQASLLNSFWLGLSTQLSNPKTILTIAGIFAAFMPQNPPPYTTMLVALAAYIIDFAWYALVALSLSTTRSRAVYAKAKTGFDRTAAFFLAAVSIKLMVG